LALRSNFGDGLIQHGEFRAVAGGGVSHVYKTLTKTMFLAGVDQRRDARRDPDLRRAGQNGSFPLITSNDPTPGLVETFVSLHGNFARHAHCDLGVRREEVSSVKRDRFAFPPK
jgi:hypothetical protein